MIYMQLSAGNRNSWQQCRRKYKPCLQEEEELEERKEG